MRKIHIDASRSYDVLIGEGLLAETGELVRAAVGPGKAVIVSDDNVFQIYGGLVRESLENAGISTGEYVFPHGEQSKSLEEYGALLETLGMNMLTRNDMLIALGGGVTGDLTGFAAATYQRGIRFVQLPTSLLAAVDSSVGGKTAVNLKSGKNQAGCFYQPSLVICDTDTLKTLPEKEFRSGCAEVIKYAMLKDEGFFRKLMDNPADSWMPEVIEKCVSMKRDIVMKDEFDKGERMLLNFGHTVGHGVEKCSGYSVGHGYAVSIGMAVITRAAERRGVCPEGTSRLLEEMLKRYHLPVELPYNPEDIAGAALSDKKKSGEKINIVLPERIGSCFIHTINVKELIEWI